MTDQTDNDFEGEKTKPRDSEALSRKDMHQVHHPNSGENSGNLRVVSHFVLFMAAVFAVNAMETGSYRTPWPVAVLTAIAGFWLLIYSRRQQSRLKKK